MSKILVTGGCGFIGSHMCKMLNGQGIDYIIFDNLSRSTTKYIDSNKFFKGDLLDPNTLEDCFSQFEIDSVIHFAALAYVGESVLNPIDYYNNNVTGTLNLLKTMLQFNVHKIVFSSTCATYGNPVYLPIDEHHPQNPINPYGSSKLLVEKVMRDLACASKLSTVSLRYFNAAGCDPDSHLREDHDPETHIIPLILKEAERVLDGGCPDNTTLEVFGTNLSTIDGSCVRDFVHVNDLCSAHLLALKYLQKIPNNVFKAYNLSTGTGTSIKQLITSSEKVTGVSITTNDRPARTGDPEELIGDGSLAMKELGWLPKYNNIEEIMRHVWLKMRNSK